uniref:Prephenate dehydrogenase n=1 Tax=Candidatus Kentrum sp. LPFa TaxID=2126335 RepID=A0A450XY45_9GAMM|nr:MAG: Prephenate dehydrogenase [Candidatus Kentron sp. LPFa]VFK34186.1 MAG: Prephenate dehydrogenase [Candidatus Kentron sp. LPFa]
MKKLLKSRMRENRILAATSHLPHLLAYSHDRCIAENGWRRRNLALHRRLRDFSRLAASDPQMWADIRLANADAILPLLEDFDSQLKSITHAIRGGEGESLKALFARAVEYRGRQYGRVVV